MSSRHEARTLRGTAAWEASIDRDDALRAAQPPRPSSSDPLRRCATCGQWPVMDKQKRCRATGSPHVYVPAPIVGQPIIRG